MTLAPAKEAPTTRPDSLPRPFGNYLLIARLARGGMGSVFLAKSGGLVGIEKYCVVKMLRSRHSTDPEYVARFVEEARIVVQLTHRNICAVFDVGGVGPQSSPVYYLAMELVVGRDLRTLVDAIGHRLPPACAIFAMTEVLDALDYSHRHVDPMSGEPMRLVHRDVSPQNIMVNAEGEVKLVDFGLASSREPEELTGSMPTVIGKIAYMAPEHARGENVDGRADQFSAAVVLLELLGRARYYGDLPHRDVWSVAGAGSFRSKLLDDDNVVAPALRPILERALAPAASDRFATCADFRDALVSYTRTTNQHADARTLRAAVATPLDAAVTEVRELMRTTSGLSVPRPATTASATQPASQSGAGFDVMTTAGVSTSTSSAVPALGSSSEEGAHSTGEAFQLPDTIAVEQTILVARRVGVREDENEPVTPDAPPFAAPGRARLFAATFAILAAVGIAAAVVAAINDSGTNTETTTTAAATGAATTTATPTETASPPTPTGNVQHEEVTTPLPTTPTPSTTTPTPSPKHRRETKPAKAPAAPAPVTLPAKLDALGRCAKRISCAAELPKKRGAIGSMTQAELEAFKAAVTSCLSKCSRS